MVVPVVALAALLLAAGTPAAAHMQAAQGRLLDLVRRSDRLLIAKVHTLGSVADGMRPLQVTIAAADGSDAERTTLQVPARLSVRSGRPYAFFVVRDDAGWTCIHNPGTVLPAPDRGREFVAFDRALRPLPADDLAGVTVVFLAALRADSRELRYHAALVLLDAVHDDHPLAARQRAALRAALGRDDFDPQLRPVLEPLAAESR